jgi:hypothetical protein
MITLDFFRYCEIHNREEVVLRDYKAFFRFFQKNHDQGVICNAKEVGKKPKISKHKGKIL